MNLKLLIIILISLVTTSCGREWLDIRSDKALVVPSTLQDAQALLERYQIMNLARTPVLGVIGSDEYILQDDQWPSLPVWEANSYIWNKEIFVDNLGLENWANSYQQIYYANLALETAMKVEANISNGSERTTFNTIVGRSLFFRAWAYFQLSQLFCDSYIMNPHSPLGLPIRDNTDLDVILKRSTIKETYERIESDLRQAIVLLPNLAEHTSHPSKAAAHGLMSRLFLSMGEYKEAAAHADSCLNLYPTLTDYNDLDLTLANPFPQFNDEILFYSTVQYAQILTFTRTNVHPELYNLYEEKDIRKQAYFVDNGSTVNFKGGYSGSTSAAFGGLATDEIYLIKAEAETRIGNIAEGLHNLNHLLKHRCRDFENIEIDNSQTLLDIILEERRKELIFRGLSWYDLKRLNNDSRTSRTLMRNLNGETYFLPPNDKRYTYPIPTLVIDIGGYDQNER